MSEFYGDLDSFGSVILDRIKNNYVGKKIGFTCSCFDILHSGHALMLQDAKKYCDILVVGLQSDPTIDRKTKNKPIQDLEERRIMLSSIKYVDEIVDYCTEYELEQLLKYLNPDVRILGTDWKGKNFTGCNLPIEIHWHSRDHNWSTSYLRKRVYEAEKLKL